MISVRDVEWVKMNELVEAKDRCDEKKCYKTCVLPSLYIDCVVDRPSRCCDRIGLELGLGYVRSTAIHVPRERTRLWRPRAREFNTRRIAR